MSFGRFAYTLILPDMMRVLGLTTSLMGVLGTCIVAGYLLFSLLSGNLAGIIGPARTVKMSAAAVSLALTALGTFSRFIPLAAASALLGAGAAGSYIPLISILNHSCERKGSAFGIVMGGAGLGIVLVGYALPPILSLSATLGYRLSWYALAVVNTMVLLLALFLLDGGEPVDREQDRAETSEKSEGRGHSLSLPASAGWIRENRPLFITIAVYFLVGFSYIIYVTYFGAYAVSEIGFTTRKTGAMWSLFGINSIYSGLLWGFFSDKTNKTAIATLATALLAISILIVIPFSSSFFFFASTFLFGFSFMGFIVVTASLISDHADRRMMAQVFGASTLIHGSGQVLGAFLAGILKDATGSFRTPFLLSSTVLGAGVFLFTLVHRLHRSRDRAAQI